ncbi:hypothetical protein PS2_040192 [Malus domestica]
MEIGGNMDMLSHDVNNFSSRGQNGSSNSQLPNSWGIWDTTTTSHTTAAPTNNNNHVLYSTAATAVTVAAIGEEASSSSTTGGHALFTGHPLHHQFSNMYSCWADHGGGPHFHQDPHLMCLKLGKRHYFEDHGNHAPPLDERHVAGFPVGMMSKKGKAAAAAAQLYGAGQPLALKVVPRCQVEGCHVALLNAKEYHRRHKVCAMHSKASRVTVLGQDQRFCQQCSRFHVVSEFDESKRSCRRRLAGHNERRRKSSNDPLARSSSQDKKLMTGRFQYLSSMTGRALSLLSSKTTRDSWVSTSDLSSRSSTALRELIAENRAANLARQLMSSDRNWDSSSHNNNATEDLFCDHGQSWSNSLEPHQHQMFTENQHGWDRFHESSGAHLTLDLRRPPSQAYGFMSERAKTKAEEDQECDLWNSFQGTSVV